MIEELNDLYKLHLIALKLDHAIKYGSENNCENNCQWKRFSPSKFVYSYFVFNSLFSKDWAGSTVQLIELDRYETKEFERIKAMLEFIGQNRFRESLAGRIEGHLDTFGMNVTAAKNRLLEIHSPARGISPEAFRSAFDSVMQRQENGELMEEVKKVVEFVYGVRCNIFHGSKAIYQLLEDEEQIERLKIYTAILFAVNELLFEAVSEKFPEWAPDPALSIQ